MSVGKGVAIAGIWAAAAVICCLNPVSVLVVIIGATIVSVTIVEAKERD